MMVATEAVDLYRELAGQRPDPYQSYLALSLATQANSLDSLGRAANAVAANAEAIKMLSTAFTGQPAAFWHWMAPMVRQYRERCERLKCDPDMEMLDPIVTILQNQQSKTQG
jgi:hypothetical protein